MIEKGDRPGGDGDQPPDHVHERGLPGRIVAKEADRLAAPYLEVDAVKDFQAPYPARTPRTSSNVELRAEVGLGDGGILYRRGGGPVGDLPAPVEHHDAVGDTVTTRMLCSTSRIVYPRARMARSVSMISTRSCGFSPAAGSSTSRSRGSEASAIAISSRHRFAKDSAAAGSGQRSGGNRPGNMAEDLRGPLAGLLLLARGAAAGDRVDPSGAEARVHGREHVVEEADAPEQLPRLEGPRKAEGADLVGGTANELHGTLALGEGDQPRIEAVEAGQAVEERRLARAIGADAAHDIAGRDGEIHPVDRDQGPEPLGETVHGEEGAGRPPESSRARPGGAELRASAPIPSGLTLTSRMSSDPNTVSFQS